MHEIRDEIAIAARKGHVCCLYLDKICPDFDGGWNENYDLPTHQLFDAKVFFKDYDKIFHDNEKLDRITDEKVDKFQLSPSF